ncbi:Sec20-domain-containing protein [Blastocladiella britannica]|nr:Sec20-domain-containing protein [Blastocladiella britannica]
MSPTGTAASLAALDRHAARVQTLLVPLKPLVSSKALTSDADWNTHAAPTRHALAQWHDEIANASDLLKTSVSDSDRHLLSAAVDESTKLKAIHEDSLRRLAADARKTIQRQAIEQRRELLLQQGTATAGDQSNGLRLRGSEKDQASRAAKEATATLQRMTQMMAQELEKSATNVTALDTQTRLLKQVKNEHNSLGGVLQSTKSLLTDLEHRDRTDKLIIGFAVLVFVSVVAYILKKRVFFFLFP